MATNTGGATPPAVGTVDTAGGAGTANPTDGAGTTPVGVPTGGATSSATTAPSSTGTAATPTPTTAAPAPAPSSTTPAATTTSTGDFVGEDTSGGLIVVVDPPPPPDGQLVAGEVCASKGVTFETLLPSVLILVDRSTSMFASNLPNGDSPVFGTYPDRWSAVRDAVAALEPLSEDVAFGITTYTGYKPGNNGGLCPELPQIDQLIPGQATFGDILAALPENTVALPPAKSETPTYEAIVAGAEALGKVTIAGPKYLLVLTDGNPDTCAVQDPQCGMDAAIGAAQAAFDQGIKTFVIGLGEDKDVAGKFLNDLAHAGQGLDVQPPADSETWCIGQELQARGSTVNFDINNYRDTADATYGADGLAYADDLYFRPGDVAALQSQLTAVIEGVRTCEYEMDVEIATSQASKGGVRITLQDGTTQDLAYGAADGWAMSTANNYTVVIQGAACDQILTDQVSDLAIEFPCDIQVPRVR